MLKYLLYCLLMTISLVEPGSAQSKWLGTKSLESGFIGGYREILTVGEHDVSFGALMPTIRDNEITGVMEQPGATVLRIDARKKAGASEVISIRRDNAVIHLVITGNQMNLYDAKGVNLTSYFRVHRTEDCRDHLVSDQALPLLLRGSGKTEKSGDDVTPEMRKEMNQNE